MERVYFKKVEFKDLKGKTITKIEGAEVGSDRILFFCSDGSIYLMSTIVEDGKSCVENISGEIHSILDNRIIIAEKVTTIIRDMLEKMKEPLVESMESICDGVTTDTSVLFNLSTVKGKVSIKWFARSHNVEDVFFCKKTPYSVDIDSYHYFRV